MTATTTYIPLADREHADLIHLEPGKHDEWFILTTLIRPGFREKQFTFIVEALDLPTALYRFGKKPNHKDHRIERVVSTAQAPKEDRDLIFHGRVIINMDAR